MSEENIPYNIASELSNRVLRNAKPGNKNNPNSGLFIIKTDEFSDDLPVANYLIEPEGQDAFGAVTYKSTINPVDDNPDNDVFVYSRDTDTWRIISSGDAIVGVNTNKDDEYVPMGDNEYPAEETGIETLSISLGNDIDMYNEGHTDKDLPLNPVDANAITFEPVPYPSVLTDPTSTDANPVITINNTAQEEGADYLLSFSNNPIYDGYRPLSSEAIVANIHVLDEFGENPYDIPEDFDGSLFLKEDGEPINNIRGTYIEESGETVENVITAVYASDTGDDVEEVLELNKDYLLNTDAGQIITMGYNEEETPVKNILGLLDVYSDGLYVKKANVGTLDDAIADSVSDNPTMFDDALTLTEGVDFAVNGKNGGLLMLKPLEPGAGVQIEYLVEGATTTSEFAKEDAPDMRLDYYPVMPGTAVVKLDLNGKYKLLVEGTDYELMYSNGSIVLTDSLKDTYSLDTKEYSVHVEYSPATPIKCLAVQKSGSDMTMYYQDVAIQAVRGNIIKLFTDGEDFEFTSLKYFDGTETNTYLAGIEQLEDGTFKLRKSIPNVVANDYLLASFKTTSSTLSYTPMVRLRSTLEEGQTDLIFEDRQKGDLDISENDVLLINSTLNTSLAEYARVSSVENLDTLNMIVYLETPISTDIRSPRVYKTDRPLDDFEAEADYDIFSLDASELLLTVDEDTNIGPGYLLNLGGKQIVKISGVVREESSSRVTIKPATVVSSEDIDSINISPYAVYQEGDNGLLLENPAASTAVPVVTIKQIDVAPDPENPEEVRHSFEIKDEKLIHTRRLQDKYGSITSAEEPYDLDGTLKSLIDELKADNVGELEEEYYRDIPENIAASSIADSVLGINPLQTPFTISAFPSVSKNGTVLGLDTDYEITSGVIVLNEPMVGGDEFKVSYTYPNTLGLVEGDSLLVQGTRFVATPKNSSVHLDLDYKANDQHMIQGLTEAGFYEEYITHYIEDMKKAALGSAPQGSEGLEAPGGSNVAEGGVNNNHMLLRDQWLSHNILWKVKEELVVLMSYFTDEMKYSSGSKLGNNEYVPYQATPDHRDRSRRIEDINSQAALSESSFYPSWYESLEPLKDARYSASYIAYDKVTVTNSGAGKAGVLSCAGTEHDIIEGDKIRISGFPGEYTVVSYSSGEIELDRSVTGGSTAKPSEPTSYRVTRSDTRAGRTLVDEQGCSGLVAKSPTTGLIDLSSTEINYVFELYGEDLSWVPVKLSIANTDDTDWLTLVNEEEAVTLDQMAELMSLFLTTTEEDPTEEENISDYFLVTVETTYDAMAINEDTENALVIDWPFELPDVEGLEAKGDRLVIRAKSNDTHIRFPEELPEEYPGYKVDLGFPTDAIYSGNQYLDSSENNSSVESDARAEELTSLEDYGFVVNKLTRGLDPDAGSQIDVTEDSKIAAEDLGTTITSAKDKATLISDNFEEGTDAKTEALAAIVVYGNQLLETSNSIPQSDNFLALLDSSNSNSLVNDLETNTWSADDINDVLYTEWASSYNALVNLKRSASPSAATDANTYVVYGDKTTLNTTYLGPSNNGISVFPFYASDSYPLGSWFIAGTDGYDQTPIFKFSNIVEIAPSVDITVHGLADNLEIVAPSGTTNIAYAANPTAQELADAISTITGVTATVSTDVAPSDVYGAILPMTNPETISTGTTLTVPGKCLSDLSFYTISDDIYIDRVASVTTRETELERYRTEYSNREEELLGNILDDEKLPDQIQEWLVKDLHRTYGPANRILPLKRTIKEG